MLLMGVIILSIQIPKPKDIEVNRWYVSLIGQSEELCKITRHHLTPDWKVVCYYTGRDLFAGSLAECRAWLCDRLLIVRRAK